MDLTMLYKRPQTAPVSQTFVSELRIIYSDKTTPKPTWFGLRTGVAPRIASSQQLIRDALCGFCLSDTDPHSWLESTKPRRQCEKGIKLDREPCVCDSPHYLSPSCRRYHSGVLDPSTFPQADDCGHANAHAPSLQGLLKILAKERCQRTRSDERSKYFLKKH